MRMEDVNARKTYIQNVRKSFDSPERNYEFEKEADTKEKGEALEGFSFFKIRLIVAALLFAAYIYCDRTDTAVYHVSTKEVTEKISVDFDYEKAGDEILEAFHSILPK